MKKKLLSTFVCIVILLANVLPAQASVAGSQGAEPYFVCPNQEMYEFWRTHGDELSERYGIFPSSTLTFSEGLMPVYSVKLSKWFYINEKAEVVDLNQGRFDRVYPFSDGLAAVVENVNGRYGYINTSGAIVIEPQFVPLDVQIDHNPVKPPITGYDYSLWPDKPYAQVGKFVNGKALIAGTWDDNSHYVEDQKPWEDPARHLTGKMTNRNETWDKFFWGNVGEEYKFRGIDYVYIDKTGRFISPIENFRTEMDALVGLQGLTHDFAGVGTEGWLRRPPEPSEPNPVVPYVSYNGGAGAEPITPVIPELPKKTYGMASYKSLGYTIVGNIGYLSIEVTNPSEATDSGDLFYALYNKHTADSRHGSADGYVPGDFLRQIHYEVGPGETKLLRVPVGETIDIGRGFTEEELAYGWHDNPEVESSRYILAQAENETERDELIALFKQLHYFVEMSLDYQPDKNGVTILAAPGGFGREAQILDEKFAAFMAQF